MTEVSIVIVSYQTRDYLRSCLESIYRNTSPGLSFEVIVVDNASSDGSAAMITSEFPSVQLVALSENVGFGRGCNRGAEVATGDYICLINPDAALVGDTVTNLVGFAREHPNNGIWGGRSLNADGSVDPRSCWALPSVWSTFCFGAGLSTLFRGSKVFDPESIGSWQRDSVREVGIVTGYLLLASKHAWTTLKGFDEQYFLYSEDADLGARASAHGFQPIITPDAVVMHVGGAASTKAAKLQFMMTGKATYARKHWSGWRRRVALASLWSGAGLRAQHTG